MSEMLFRDDAYMREAVGVVTGHTPEGGIVVDRSIFYPTGGGQPGDSGRIGWNGRDMQIATAVKGEGDDIVLVPAVPMALPAVGTQITQEIDWERRHRHMRVHTAMHLLSVVLPLPVTGGQIGAEKGRLDFAMPEPPEDKQAVEDALNELIDRDLVVWESSITDEELDAKPGLVKTMSVQPPRGAGKVRLVAIGEGEEQIDLQPCGGTHVARTAEIGRIRLGKVENKGKQNRRVHIYLD
ncbi:alanyl-tRNA editing protein [Alisedimentitalea sp. MJ-SS2]|uniref:alanyl-tRNA editing protein n=1 Tax=Aliisedimentitalea sp. MJ-SS2 TaxID=3049795 RepID=UPI002911ADC4|nr:alanyl-tRNA editing protein [Alisedimentitalea sp. MJ-SS2]MDU8929213.1 alanyl-tRNA editing protein [Alisedimentitalea sp. MJ-SS2]